MIEQFTETKLTIMIVAMNLALMDNWIEANVIITFVVQYKPLKTCLNNNLRLKHLWPYHLKFYIYQQPCIERPPIF